MQIKTGSQNLPFLRPKGYAKSQNLRREKGDIEEMWRPSTINQDNRIFVGFQKQQAFYMDKGVGKFSYVVGRK